MGGLQFRFGSSADIRIDGEGDIVGDAHRRLLHWRGKAIALLQRIHFQRVDSIDDVFELVAELRAGFEVNSAGQHGVHRVIEIPLGGNQIAGVVVPHAAFVVVLRGGDHLLLLRAWRRRRLL